MSIRQKYSESETSSDFDFEPVPKGRYNCELLDASARQRLFGSNEWETEVNWQIVDGPSAGRRIRQKCVHRESMAWMMRQTWEAVGLGGAPWDGLDPQSSDAEIWGNWTHQIHLRAGARCALKVDINRWKTGNGEPRAENTVGGISPLAASTANAPAPAYEAPAANQYGGHGHGNEAPAHQAPVDNGRPW